MYLEVMTVRSARVRGTGGYLCFTTGRERRRGKGEGQGERRGEERREFDFSPVEDPDRVLCGKRN